MLETQVEKNVYSKYRELRNYLVCHFGDLVGLCPEPSCREINDDYHMAVAAVATTTTTATTGGGRGGGGGGGGQCTSKLATRGCWQHLI